MGPAEYAAHKVTLQVRKELPRPQSRRKAAQKAPLAWGGKA